MASGSAVRFGSNKLLYPVDGVPMVERAFSAVPPELFARACVVSCYPEILALAEKRGYLPIPNPEAAQGQSASVRLGLAELAELDGRLAQAAGVQRDSEKLVGSYRLEIERFLRLETVTNLDLRKIIDHIGVTRGGRAQIVLKRLDGGGMSQNLPSWCGR